MGVGSRLHAIHSDSLLNASSQENSSCACEECAFLPETSKLQRGKKSYRGPTWKTLGVTELRLFVEKAEGMEHPVGLYLHLTAFHSASEVPRPLRSQSGCIYNHKKKMNTKNFCLVIETPWI